MPITREQAAEILNSSDLGSSMSGLRRAVLAQAAARLHPGDAEPPSREQEDIALLAQVGPGAAEDAFRFSYDHCLAGGRIAPVSLTTNLSQNVRLVHKSARLTQNSEEAGDGCPSFTNVLRQFLLPRYAYLDFDTVVDPRHRVDTECGYPKFITPIMYRYMYDRDDVASRVVDFYPDESWAVDPVVADTEDPNAPSPFNDRWQELCEEYNLLQYLYRIDKLCGIGHYGVLLLGLDDGLDLEAPVQEKGLLAGARRGVSSKQRELLYLRPFDEYLSFIHQYETDVLHPRYGLPKFYNLVFLDMTIDAAGASIGTRLNRRVHWSRVVHVADNLHGSLVFGRPRQQAVFNRLLDLRKMKGATAEMLWKGGWPGLNFEIDPAFVADEVIQDEDKFRKAVDEYEAGLSRYLKTVGIKVTTLMPAIPTDPDKYIHLQVAAIAAHMNAPLRLFLGSEEGRVASSQDKLTWNQRLGRRNKVFVRPGILRNVVDRFVALGVMPPPQNGKYTTAWPDLNTPTDEDKANLALKWTQAMSQYVASGCVHLISPMDYLTTIVGLQPSLAKRILDALPGGSLAKLLKVDPSQGSGVNGVRENNVTKGSTEGTSREQPTKRDSGDKKVEGTAS